MQIQTHVSKYKCSADSCVPFHMPYIGRILNMNKINFTLLGNQVTKLLISTMIHLELFPNTASIYTAFPLKLLVQNENQMSSTPNVLPASLLLPPWLTKDTHYSTFKSCKICGISLPCFQRSQKYPCDTQGISSFPGLWVFFNSLLYF